MGALEAHELRRNRAKQDKLWSVLCSLLPGVSWHRHSRGVDPGANKEFSTFSTGLGISESWLTSRMHQSDVAVSAHHRKTHRSPPIYAISRVGIGCLSDRTEVSVELRPKFSCHPPVRQSPLFRAFTGMVSSFGRWWSFRLSGRRRRP